MNNPGLIAMAQCCRKVLS